MTTPVMPAPAAHAPISMLNRTGSGIRTIIICSCGWTPSKAPERGSTMHNAHDAHRRAHGLRKDTCPADVYGEGPAKGLTWDQWYAANPGLDPFGVRD